MLIGDALWDPSNRKNLAVKDYVPSYMKRESPQAAAQDNWFVRVDERSGLEHLFIGRISVQKAEELENVVEKIIEYEQTALPGLWKAKTLLVSDDGYEEELNQVAENFFSQGAVCQHISQSELPFIRSIRLKNQGLDIQYCMPGTAAIVDEVDEGCHYLMYMGHGGATVLSHERILLGTDRGDSDILKMRNGPKYPVFFSMSCLTGLFTFDEPLPGVCFAEEWLRQPGKGGIAAFCPTGKGGTSQHIKLAKGIIQGEFREYLHRFGQVFAYAKVFYWNRMLNNYLGSDYIYFGDPACKSHLPRHSVEFDFGKVNRQYGRIGISEVNAKVDSPLLASAAAQFYIMTPNAGELWRSDQLEVSNGTISVTPPWDELGEFNGQVGCYVWDSVSGVDAFGTIALSISRPDVSLTNLTLAPEVDPDALVATAEIANMKDIDVMGDLLLEWDVNGVSETVKLDLIEALESRSVVKRFSAGSGVYRVSARLYGDALEYELNTSDNTQKRVFIWQGPELAGASKLAMSPLDITWEGDRTSVVDSEGQVRHCVRATIFNYGGKLATDVSAVLKQDSDNRVLDQKTGLVISPSDSKRIDFECGRTDGRLRVEVHEGR